MITVAPLPRWRDLPAAFFGQPPPADTLAAPWRRGDEAALWYSRAAWGLAAIVSWYAEKTDGERPRLWLPDYFCNQSTAAARNAGARITFYPIGPDLQPDWPACRMLVGESPPDLFVLVHYFGWAADGAAARDFCDSVGAVLIEDGAHVLRPAPGIGEHGEFILYSPGKVLAVPHGGLLLVRDRVDPDDLENAAGIPMEAANMTRRWLFKRLAQRTLTPFGLCRSRRPRAFGEDPPTTRLPATPRPAIGALRLISRQARALERIAAKRRNNARRLAEVLVARGDVKPFFSDDAMPRAPYRLVLRCDDAPAVYERLWAAGCPVESWPDMPPEVIKHGERHVEALKLRRSLLLVPVHQSLAVGRLIRQLS